MLSSENKWFLNMLMRAKNSIYKTPFQFDRKKNYLRVVMVSYHYIRSGIDIAEYKDHTRGY